MAVIEPDFAATLLSNLNLEDPWLPPSSWESIPSESGPRFPPSTDHPPTRPQSSVSEESLVRLAMNALQGVQSAIISIEKISSAFCSDPTDRTFHRIPGLWNRASSTHAQGKILKSIGCSGFLVFLLRRFVDHFCNSNRDDKQENSQGEELHERPPYSLVNHAYSVAVGKVIEGYVCALDTLYASVRLRHSSESAQARLGTASSGGCLTAVVHSEVTLLELYLHTDEVRTQIEALGNICNLCRIASCFTESSFDDLITKSDLEYCNFCQGGDLLSYLYAQLQVADPPHRALLKFLFLRSCEPYYGFINSWMYKAEINDPYKEFIVEQVDTFFSQHHGKPNVSQDFPLASIRERDGVSVPCFLRDFIMPLVRAGQQLQVLMKLLELCVYVDSKDLTLEDLLPCFNGFSSNYSANACPITFNKAEIEARVITRGNYYKKMQEKLESLMTKIEFRYQQIISHDVTPNDIGRGLRSSDDPASFKLDDSLVVALAEAKGYSDDSSTRDDNAYEPFEFSSSTDSEEELLSEQLTDLSGSDADLEEKYLLVLNFSVEKSWEKLREFAELHNVESDIDRAREGRNNANQCDKSNENETLRGQISMAIKSDEQNWLVSYNRRPNLLNFQEKLNTVSHDGRMVFLNDALPEELFEKEQPEMNTLNPDLFKLKDFKETSHHNFLSMNPMLAKRGFTVDDGKLGQSIPYFDFSLVEDPCTGSLENFTAETIDSSVASTIKNDLPDGKENNQDNLINNSERYKDNSLSELAEYKQEDATSALVSGGSSWESLLSRSANVCRSSADRKELPLTKFDVPLDYIIEKCLQQEIMLQYSYVSKLTIKLLEEGFDFKEHLLALRRYHFMELADWANLFIIALSNHKWCITEASQRLAEIQGFLELSIQRSSCEFDTNKDRLYVYMKGHDKLPLTASATGLHSFDFLGLGYRVDWPISIVLTSEALRIYSEIFSFLMKVKLALFSLTDVWHFLKELRPSIPHSQRAEQQDQDTSNFHLLIKIRHQINHFISTLQQYIESQLSHVSWCRFLHSLQHKVKDMMDLESVHMAYIIDSLHVCFLSEETQVITGIIDSILQCALDFRSCLRGGMWDVGINHEDPSQKLSRIKISQVISIKKRLDKNLQELHLHYLKSPKHGEHGLSRFWGYLNFNEYYSDSGNEMMHYAFSL